MNIEISILKDMFEMSENLTRKYLQLHGVEVSPLGLVDLSSILRYLRRYPEDRILFERYEPETPDQKWAQNLILCRCELRERMKMYETNQ